MHKLIFLTLLAAGLTIGPVAIPVGARAEDNAASTASVKADETGPAKAKKSGQKKKANKEKAAKEGKGKIKKCKAEGTCKKKGKKSKAGREAAAE